MKALSIILAILFSTVLSLWVLWGILVQLSLQHNYMPLYIFATAALFTLVLAGSIMVFYFRAAAPRYVYLLALQHLLVAAFGTLLLGILRGWYVWVQGLTTVYDVGWYNSEEFTLEDIYNDVGILMLTRVPIPHWHWNLLAGIAAALLIASMAWVWRSRPRRANQSGQASYSSRV
ncbi:hypothetical protein [Paenibacillus sp. MMS18-CY102]|uniref:hypothetical protein n=1 Tax=Paenibacillus sp. MMS18-CY102 TaxID=2682849 RepID=UPI0013665BC8|nr:hypothetical protein [Paenibacillus sp. MMS18-CY102]MWC29372.1 hypothetical protein [Paenibacillus sp. MMS18-CY102]